MKPSILRRISVLSALLGILVHDLWLFSSLPSSSQTAPKWTKLDAEMFNLALQAGQTQKERRRKEQAIKTVKTVVMNRFPQSEFQVIPFGSSVTGLNEGSSDVDLVLFFPERPLPSYQILRRLRAIFAKRRDTKIILTLLFKRAKIPLLTLEVNGVSCDLTCQNMLPVFNTALLRGYADLLPEMTALAMVVKRWAKANGFGQVQMGAISSYTWTLMLVPCTCESFLASLADPQQQTHVS